MINVRFSNKKFKIYSNLKVKCLEPCEHSTILQLKRLVVMIMMSYNNPSDGFPVSFLANKLANYGIEVMSYRDYEMENAPDGRIY